MTNQDLTGGQAYPSDGPWDRTPNAQPGMTLLDWFAGISLGRGNSPSVAYREAARMLEARKEFMANKEEQHPPG